MSTDTKPADKNEAQGVFDALTTYGMKHIDTLPQEVIEAMDVVGNYLGDVSHGRIYTPDTKPDSELAEVLEKIGAIHLPITGTMTANGQKYYQIQAQELYAIAPIIEAYVQERETAALIEELQWLQKQDFVKYPSENYFTERIAELSHTTKGGEDE